MTGPALSDKHLENVSEVAGAKDLSIYERHIMLNSLMALYKYSSVTIQPSYKVLYYANPVKQNAGTTKSKKIKTEDE